MTQDPVCGMKIEEAQAFATVQHQGVTYHFCSAKCQQTFQANPAKYAKAPSAQKPR
ncbi:MAG: YHS domain-containing protein [Pseudomonadota bacterium]|nr:YHS domain-containing protein [Nevskiales bacterium]MEC9363552.1 YHS domain-containing protein [Pseudomonadota bacterium]